MSHTDEETLQRICEEVSQTVFGYAKSDTYADFAKAVARRYAATVGAVETDEPIAIFQVRDGDLGADFLAAYCRDGKLTVEIEEPWAGDTETGFGQTCSIGLDLDEAEAFARWILVTIKSQRRTPPTT